MSNLKKLQPFGVAIVAYEGDIKYLEKITAVTFAENAAEACRRVKRFWKDTAGYELYALPVFSPIMRELLQRLVDGPMTPTAAIAMYAQLEAIKAAAIAKARVRKRRSDAGKPRVPVVQAPALPPVAAVVPASHGIDPFRVIGRVKAPASAPRVIKPGVNDLASAGPSVAGPTNVDVMQAIAALTAALAGKLAPAPVQQAAVPAPAPKAKKPMPAGLAAHKARKVAEKLAAANIASSAAVAAAAEAGDEAAFVTAMEEREAEQDEADALAVDRPPLESMGLNVPAPDASAEAAKAPAAAPVDASARTARRRGKRAARA